MYIEFWKKSWKQLLFHNEEEIKQQLIRKDPK